MESQEFNREWIIEHSKKELAEYYEGITLRQLYYRLVAQGMTNDIKHYKKVVAAMTKARWDGIVDLESFIDRERSMYGSTEAEEKDLEEEIETAKSVIKHCMTSHKLNKWSNQEKYIEVWIEKKALQGVFEDPCDAMDVGLAPCKGYPSLTFLNQAKKRFANAESDGKHLLILYFGDYDPSGEDIPRSVKDNIERLGVEVEVKVLALKPELIEELGLPGVPPKLTDSRTATWDGDGAVELDAVEPKILKQMCKDAIKEEFDEDLHEELLDKEETERKQYQEELKEFVKELKTDDEDDEGGE